MAGSGRKKAKLRNIVQYFAVEKCKEAGAKKYRAGTGIKGYRLKSTPTAREKEASLQREQPL